ncbi:hypothetical protein Poli38472_014354 [Pythium oligandrum]|uniref:AB hydrolase-1 domain-containing protein n=1 Tax=Pythium oligandrum TaxID=41045 RepID=A0A8K1FCY6_PYTOL|nr:hypothetical protein Poli38472_014354 [Pythium oligandrum]|eukprot:TMW57751.1 hypothetical protein Poli38472_014354 [Pythium oligandrum]
MTSKRAATLLFCHGGSFSKEIWSPIIKRVQAATLLQKKPAHVVTFDFPYHGTRRDESHPAKVTYENDKTARVEHPAMHWAKWTADEVWGEVQKIQAKPEEERGPLIGIGHSFGAAGLWSTEIARPGTFDGLLLFEPVSNMENFTNVEDLMNFLILLALNRSNGWNSLEEAEADFKSNKAFARWHPESLKAYLHSAIVKNEDADVAFDKSKPCTLACHPHIEASLYNGPELNLSMEQMGRVQCKTTFHYGERSVLFFPQHKEALLQTFPDIYRIGSPVPKTSHLLVLEDPDTVAQRIVETLEELPAFN